MKVVLQFVILSICLLWSNIPSSGQMQAEGRMIWNQAEHNAFTDLIRFNDHFYCSFREGSGHIPGTDGTVRILKSADGKQWESVALLKKEGVDLRDPKLSITPKGKLMVIIGGSIYEKGKLMGRNPHVSFSDKAGNAFTAPEKVKVSKDLENWGSWFWRVTWHHKVGYAIDYQIGPEERRGPTAMYLVKTKDGKKFEKVSEISLDGFPNEATVRFDKNGTLYAMIRRETADQVGIWARSNAPYTSWEFQKMDVRLGGPNFIFTDNEEVIAGTRMYQPAAYTALLKGNKSGEFKEVVKYTSSGDTSYPGLVVHEGVLWVSYYSSHEGKSAIYISEIDMKTLPR